MEDFNDTQDNDEYNEMNTEDWDFDQETLIPYVEYAVRLYNSVVLSQPEDRQLAISQYLFLQSAIENMVSSQIISELGDYDLADIATVLEQIVDKAVDIDIPDNNPTTYTIDEVLAELE